MVTGAPQPRSPINLLGNFDNALETIQTRLPSEKARTADRCKLRCTGFFPIIMIQC